MTDHEEIEVLFRNSMAALHCSLPPEAHAFLDQVWMRLAVHIRAEHKVIFPALAEARPDLGELLQTLREDHDYFMATLAESMNHLRGPSPNFALTKDAVEAVRLRIKSHNALEETLIYPAADQLPSDQQDRISQDVSRELAFLPKRYSP